MKIISKHKDYYDYIKGIYGEDDKLVLERSTMSSTYIPTSDSFLLEIYFCDLLYSGLIHNGEVYWGEDIVQFESKKPSSYFWITNYTKESTAKYYNVLLKNHRFNHLHIRKDPIESKANEICCCPILILINSYSSYNKKIDYAKLDKFPILKDYNFHKVLSPEDVWIKLSAWLGKDRPIISTQTDKEKIISAGFDLKSSFRNIK